MQWKQKIRDLLEPLSVQMSFERIAQTSMHEHDVPAFWYACLNRKNNAACLWPATNAGLHRKRIDLTEKISEYSGYDKSEATLQPKGRILVRIKFLDQPENLWSFILHLSSISDANLLIVQFLQNCLRLGISSIAYPILETFFLG